MRLNRKRDVSPSTAADIGDLICPSDFLTEIRTLEGKKMDAMMKDETLGKNATKMNDETLC